jgi:hypothetical protein
LLKKNGFKKKKNAWNRERGDLTDIIEIDELRGSTQDNERFVLNVGLFVPSFFEIVWNEKHKGFAQDADAVIRLRLEDFLDHSFSEEINKSWVDLNFDDVTSIGVEISRAVEDRILPYLDSISDFKALELFAKKVESRHKDYPLAQICFALLKFKNNKHDEATEILNSLASGKNKAWATRAKDVLARI